MKHPVENKTMFLFNFHYKSTFASMGTVSQSQSQTQEPGGGLDEEQLRLQLSQEHRYVGT